MCNTIETVVECLGKPVVDPYSRRLGFITSFYSDVDGKIKALEINFHDEGYREIPIERFKVSSESIVLMPEYEYRALVTENRLKLIKGRLASLEELYSRKEVPSHVYETLKKKFEEELSNVKALAREVKDVLRTKLHEVEDQVAEVERAIAALKTSYMAGEIPEKPYLVAADMMRKSLEIFLKERDNIKKHLDRIESLEALPISPALNTQQSKETGKQQEPMQVVVLG